MMVRLRAVGLVEGYRCAFPITQGELADATGVTNVHVNRVLQELRRAGLIRLESGTLTVLDWDRLHDVGDFDPVYLHLKADKATA